MFDRDGDLHLNEAEVWSLPLTPLQITPPPPVSLSLLPVSSDDQHTGQG
jgi:hypothetical protein